jgi:hypothetical protein
MRDVSQYRRSEIEEKLPQLAKGLGIRRTNLYGDLGVELRRLWGVEKTNDPVFEMAQWHLEWLIAQIKAKESTPALKKAAEAEYLQRVARVSFNISIPRDR